MNDDYEIEITFHYNRLSNNQFTLMPYSIPRASICYYLNIYYKKYMMESVKNNSNLPQYKEGEEACPFKKVSFHFNFEYRSSK